MNSTTSQTSITITTTTTKSAPVIKKVVVYDSIGRARVIEKMRGIQI